MSAKRLSKTAKDSEKAEGPRLYTLDVSILQGLMSEEFVEQNPEVSRTIQIRGDQTLEDLHYAIFDAFDRFDEHLYEFQFGKKPYDRKAKRYVLMEGYDAGDSEIAGDVVETTIDGLGLKARQSFLYWFDFGDDWWHRIGVVAIEETVPRGKFPKVTKRVGKSPPQYMYDEE